VDVGRLVDEVPDAHGFDVTNVGDAPLGGYSAVLGAADAPEGVTRPIEYGASSPSDPT
jgi:hypothetical protein